MAKCFVCIEEGIPAKYHLLLHLNILGGAKVVVSGVKFLGVDVSKCPYMCTLFFSSWSVVSSCYFHTLF